MLLGKGVNSCSTNVRNDLTDPYANMIKSNKYANGYKSQMTSIERKIISSERPHTQSQKEIVSRRNLFIADPLKLNPKSSKKTTLKQSNSSPQRRMFAHITKPISLLDLVGPTVQHKCQTNCSMNSRRGSTIMAAGSSPQNTKIVMKRQPGTESRRSSRNNQPQLTKLA